eukprot:12904287-Prorocentrum_lima.AAC.1
MPKKRAALQRKVALLPHQFQGAEKATDQVFHLIGKMSSQWGRNVVILVPQGRAPFAQWQENMAQMRPAIMKMPSVVAMSFDSFRCSIM